MLQVQQFDILFDMNGTIYVAIESSSSRFRRVACTRLNGKKMLYVQKCNLRHISDAFHGKDKLVYELSGVMPKNLYRTVKNHLALSATSEA